MPVPTRAQDLVRSAKMTTYRALRQLRWVLQPDDFPVPVLAGPLPVCQLSKRRLVARFDEDAHPVFEAGKLTNLALAAPCFDGVALGPERPLSFWRALGPITAERGFVAGMELRGGCIVPSLGGGLCLLSNLLYETSLELGWEILERHGHTLQAVPHPENQLWGLDATVLFPYVDLRVRPRQDVRLGLKLISGSLELTVHADAPCAERCELFEKHARQQGDLRENELWRRRYRGDVQVAEERVGVNRKRILDSGRRRRNCLTCNEFGCHARPGHLKQL